ncbi:MAG: PEP/pyruvate-binding domain-containing protein [Phycisphaerae bacterium]
MTQIDARLTTGLPGADRMLKGLIRGDNIVWQVDNVEDYRPFVEPYCRAARKIGEPLVYIRFAGHPPLVEDGENVRICRLDPHAGFESFVTSIHRIIESTGRGGYYVFDCLSELAEAWRSDQMLGNFFMLTCPYLYDVEAIAYFAVERNVHSYHATRAIAETTQIFLDVFRHDTHVYVHPWKVQSRHSPTMHMLHAWEQAEFCPVMDSATITEVRHTVPWLESDTNLAGLWQRTFSRAQDLAPTWPREGRPSPEARRCFERMIRLCISRDEPVLELVRKYFTLQDVVDIGKRMIGTGLVGGKSVGMLLSRAILTRTDPTYRRLLEPHDSFFIGSDVFYTYLVRNGIWSLRQHVQDPHRYLEGAERARQRMLIGSFPKSVNDQFADMLDYFGQSPIIVRSSSLLEDNFGNAFAGKYESVFCANQGSRHQRLEDFLAAVRTIYASTMSEKALTYRAQRGLLEHDEQMALLVQRVSGKMHHDLFYPLLAGVGFSLNPYVWSEEIDPEAGMARIVFGMGTRAVDRADDDYTRIVALNDPTRRPEDSFDKVKQYSQRKVDVLDLMANQLMSMRFRDVCHHSHDLPMDMLTTEATPVSTAGTPQVSGAFPHVLTFDNLLTQTHFVPCLRDMLQTLHKAYDYPVDVEFTANQVDDGFRINVVQCRPLQVKGGGNIVPVPEELEPGRVLLDAHEAVIGRGQDANIDRIVYVTPSVYGKMPVADRFAVARLVGQICHLEKREDVSILLIGPGRWGTTSPSLGVPVRFPEIDRVSAVCELVTMSENVAPDVSLGTHFFNDLIEWDILYFALFPGRSENVINMHALESAPNRLEELIRDPGRAGEAVRVIDSAHAWTNRPVSLNANPIQQRAVCYLAPK